MKKIILGVLISLCVMIATAQTSIQKVFVQYPSLLPFCSTLFAAFDRIDNTSTIVLLKAGAGGLIAIQAAQQEPNSLVCGVGAADLFLYSQIHPNYINLYKDLKVFNILYTTGTYLHASVNNQHNTLLDLLKTSTTSKPILVGFEITSAKIIGNKLISATNAPITLIPFKRASDAIASLQDGTLDLLVTNGNIMQPFVEANKIKLMGYVNDTGIVGNTQATNFNLLNLSNGNLSVFSAIAGFDNDVSEESYAKIQVKINTALKDPAVQVICKTNSYKCVGSNLTQTMQFLQNSKIKWSEASTLIPQ